MRLPTLLVGLVIATSLSIYSVNAKQETHQASHTSIKLQHAKLYRSGVKVSDYWVSEKLDGVRAYWNGKQLVSRKGNVFNAPKWFIENFPEQPLDGELWIGRSQFEVVSGIVRTKQFDNPDWHKVRYMIFDLPSHSGNFEQRVNAMIALVEASHSPYLKRVKQQKFETEAELFLQLDKVVANNGEGLMLHKANAFYQHKRTANILKLKKYYDAEAQVIAHLPGKGKYKSMMGALLVKMPNGNEFKIGSGFSDSMRQNPPQIGSQITYKYYGKTKNGIPKFASFMRVRKEENIKSSVN